MTTEKNIRLSIILVAYNMPRELPRTLLSLSQKMQREIGSEEYEVIVVDNGSSIPFDKDSCSEIMPNIQFMDVSTPSVSPCKAVNEGQHQARGDVIGVMIDGARMVSPRLLKNAIEAAELHDRAVIGTFSFHLGPQPQMQSIHNGYNQDEEDRLLATVPWEDNGYLLFDISVFAGSSRWGWHELPAETNALFMHRDMWDELDGYDEDFVSPGGGLANLDAWRRACHLPDNQVIMLHGEGTFHQFHGGVSTNSPVSRWKEFDCEYSRIRGQSYAKPDADPRFYGRFNRWSKRAGAHMT